ncbi:MAG: hypothetical protein JWP86_116 [Phenylobacterium sp.]|nr:hypothetical protein [Phenylobacterium sp.]
MRVVHPGRRVAACAVCIAMLSPASSALAAAHHPHIDRSGKPQSGVASYYGVHAAGKKTASGKKLAPNKLTAASRTLPLGTKAKVTNAETGQSVGVTVTDRGPYAKQRILDVSPKAAQHLGMKDDGVAKVKVQPLQEPPASEPAGSDKKR